MAYSFTAIPTHSVGDTLPVADYNAIANQINGNAPVFATSGTVTNTTTSGSAPFFCFAGSYNLVTDTNGFITLDNTHGFSGFPNGTIAIVATCFVANSSGTSQAGHTIQPNATYTTKSALSLNAYNQSGGNVASTAVAFSVYAVGY